MLTVVRALFPGLIVLRLADSNSPNMDKLFYYVRRLDRVLAQSKVLLDRVEQSIANDGPQQYGKLVVECLSNKDMQMEHEEDNNDGDESEVDYSSSDEADKTDSPTLGDRFLQSWDRRKVKLSHDLSVSGWMVSPIKEIFDDARSFSKGSEHREAVKRLFLKWFEHESNGNKATLGSMLNKFWDEYELFVSRQGNFQKEYYWVSDDLVSGKSHLWHKKYSVPYTEWFGRFACRVTSKILGIGSAERNWGEVKHLKTDKRSHLSADRVKKQATIFGGDCASRARLEREAVKKGKTEVDESEFFFWDTEDFDQELGFDDMGDQKKRKAKRMVRCWLEEWEPELVLEKSRTAELRLLQKYGGLEFMDIDNNNLMCHMDAEHMKWHGKKGGGWHVIVYSELWREDDPKREENVEFYAIFEDCPLHDQLVEYYTPDKELDVLAITNPPKEADGDTNDEEEDDD